MECPCCFDVTTCPSCNYSGFEHPECCEFCGRLQESDQLVEKPVPFCGRETTCQEWGYECTQVLTCQSCDPMSQTRSCEICENPDGKLTHYKVRGMPAYKVLCAGCREKDSSYW